MKISLREISPKKVIYLVKNSSSKDKLKIYLRSTGTDPDHIILIDPKISTHLQAGEIGYRLGTATKITKNKSGAITGVNSSLLVSVSK